MNESRFVDCTPMPFSVQNGNPNMWIETCSAYVFQECGKFGYMDTYNSNRCSIPIVQMFDSCAQPKIPCMPNTNNIKSLVAESDLRACI